VSDSFVTLWTFSSPGSSVRGILQARILEQVAFPSPGDLPNLQIKPGSPALQADCLPAEPGKSNTCLWLSRIQLLHMFS
jgi:hypothetical protein